VKREKKRERKRERRSDRKRRDHKHKMSTRRARKGEE